MLFLRLEETIHCPSFHVSLVLLFGVTIHITFNLPHPLPTHQHYKFVLELVGQGSPLIDALMAHINHHVDGLLSALFLTSSQPQWFTVINQLTRISLVHHWLLQWSGGRLKEVICMGCLSQLSKPLWIQYSSVVKTICLILFYSSCTPSQNILDMGSIRNI